jgi:tetratricopeptide (TPR) repeat protein
MVVVKLIKAVLIISVFFATFFPVYINISAFARESVGIPKPQKSSIDLDRIADEYPDRREILETIRAIEEELQEDPDDYPLYEALAFLYDYIGVYQKSLEAVKKQIEYYPGDEKDFGILYGNLARQCLNLNKLDEAKPAIDRSLEYDPDNIINHKHALQYYILKGQYREAGLELKTMTEIAEKQSLDIDFYYDIYIYFLNNPDYRVDMIKVCEEAVKVNPASYLSHRMLGVAIRNESLSKLDETYPRIMKELQKAFKLNPEYVPTLITIANAHGFYGLNTEQQKYCDLAIEWFNKAEELEPDDLRLQYAMGNMFVYMKEYDKAIKKLEYVMAKGNIAPEVLGVLAAAYNGKAYSFYEKGENLEEALNIINKAIILTPKDGIILSTKAEVLYKMERFEEAYKYIKEGIKLEPDNPELKQDLMNIEKALKEAHTKK